MIQQKRPTVWILKEQMRSTDTGPKVQDYTPAMKYGDLEFVTTFDPPLHTATGASYQWQEQVNRFCSAYDETRDYIICTGQPSAIFTIGFMLAQWVKRPRFLVWRREQGGYVVLEGGLDREGLEAALTRVLGIKVEAAA